MTGRTVSGGPESHRNPRHRTELPTIPGVLVHSACHEGFFHLFFQKHQLWKQEGEGQVICKELISQTQGRKEKEKEEKKKK